MPCRCALNHTDAASIMLPGAPSAIGLTTPGLLRRPPLRVPTGKVLRSPGHGERSKYDSPRRCGWVTATAPGKSGLAVGKPAIHSGSRPRRNRRNGLWLGCCFAGKDSGDLGRGSANPPCGAELPVSRDGWAAWLLAHRRRDRTAGRLELALVSPATGGPHAPGLEGHHDGGTG